MKKEDNSHLSLTRPIEFKGDAVAMIRERQHEYQKETGRHLSVPRAVNQLLCERYSLWKKSQMI